MTLQTTGGGGGGAIFGFSGAGGDIVPPPPHPKWDRFKDVSHEYLTLWHKQLFLDQS